MSTDTAVTGMRAVTMSAAVITISIRNSNRQRRMRNQQWCPRHRQQLHTYRKIRRVQRGRRFNRIVTERVFAAALVWAENSLDRVCSQNLQALYPGQLWVRPPRFFQNAKPAYE